MARHEHLLDTMGLEVVSMAWEMLTQTEAAEEFGYEGDADFILRNELCGGLLSMTVEWLGGDSYLVTECESDYGYTSCRELVCGERTLIEKYGVTEDLIYGKER